MWFQNALATLVELESVFVFQFVGFGHFLGIDAISNSGIIGEMQEGVCSYFLLPQPIGRPGSLMLPCLVLDKE